MPKGEYEHYHISGKARMPVSQLICYTSGMLLYLYHHVYTLIMGCNICCQTHEVVLSLSTVVLNSRDRQGKLWLPKMHPRKPCNNNLSKI